MSKCHADDDDLLSSLLFSKVEDLDGILPYEIANKANFEEFFCADPIQIPMNKVWAEKIENYKKYKYVPVSFLKETGM